MECKKLDIGRPASKLVSINWLNRVDQGPYIIISAGLSNEAYAKTLKFVAAFDNINFGIVRYSKTAELMQNALYDTFTGEMLNMAISGLCDVLASAIFVEIRSIGIVEISIVAKSFGAAVMQHLATNDKFSELSIAFTSLKAPTKTSAFDKPYCTCRHMTLYWSYDDQRIPISNRGDIVQMLERADVDFDCQIERNGGHEFSSVMVSDLYTKLDDFAYKYKHCNVAWVKKFVSDYKIGKACVADAHILMNEYLVYVRAVEKFAKVSGVEWLVTYAERCKTASRYFDIVPPAIPEAEVNTQIAIGGKADDLFGNKNIIIWAIETNDSALALRMIKLYPEMISVAGCFGDTPLAHAVIMSMPEVVEALLDAGVDPNQRVAFNGTVLHWAFVIGNKKIIKLLDGVHRNVTNEFGKYAEEYCE